MFFWPSCRGLVFLSSLVLLRVLKVDWLLVSTSFSEASMKDDEDELRVDFAPWFASRTTSTVCGFLFVSCVMSLKAIIETA